MDRLLDRTAREQPGASLLSPWLELVADANKVGFFNWDIANGEFSLNSGALERLGLAPGSVSSINDWVRMIDPDDAKVMFQDIEELAETRAPRLAYSYMINLPDGRLRRMEGAAHCFYDDAGALTRLAGINFDITEFRAAQDDLARSEAKLRNIVDTAPDALVLVGEDGIIRGFNLAAERAFGWKSEEMIGKHVSLLMPSELADNRDAFLSAFLGAGQARVAGTPRQLVAERSDGSQFPVDLNVGEMTIDSMRMFAGFIRDVSERVEAARKLEALRDEFLLNARMTAMGEMAGGLAHELNQPLAAAKNYIDAAEVVAAGFDGEDAAKVVEYARKAGECIQRSGEIIRRLRSFIGARKSEIQQVDAALLIGEALDLALPLLDRRFVEARVSIKPSNLSLTIDKIQIQQVLVNLIRNAVEASRDRPQPGKLEISVTSANDEVSFLLEDEGTGFRSDIIENQRPFVSTKGADSLGLGLSICRRIVESWGGSLVIRNRPVSGAAVLFTLPATGVAV